MIIAAYYDSWSQQAKDAYDVFRVALGKAIEEDCPLDALRHAVAELYPYTMDSVTQCIFVPNELWEKGGPCQVNLTDVVTLVVEQSLPLYQRGDIQVAIVVQADCGILATSNLSDPVKEKLLAALKEAS